MPRVTRLESLASYGNQFCTSAYLRQLITCKGRNYCGKGKKPDSLPQKRKWNATKDSTGKVQNSLLDELPARQFLFRVVDAVGVDARLEARNAHREHIALASDKPVNAGTAKGIRDADAAAFQVVHIADVDVQLILGRIRIGHSL